ncbi:MAG: type II toxin-antitoxin system VapC family toxin [Acidobacteria bacterium]|nr:MAG: type II toxin-antitoxin system VapC family toxin [Acidobacteriota bacterium]
MVGYLLDTNVLSFWFDSARVEHEAVIQRIEALSDHPLLAVSAITFGEIAYGYRSLGRSYDEDREAEHFGFLEDRIDLILDVNKNTRFYYGELRASLFEKYAPRSRRKKVKRPEQLVDPETSLQLGIQENDLWLAAQALEHNLVLVTHDVLDRLRTVAKELRVEDWAAR